MSFKKLCYLSHFLNCITNKKYIFTAWYLGSRALLMALKPPDLEIAFKMEAGLPETSLDLS
jgi:hypothetical protein